MVIKVSNNFQKIKLFRCLPEKVKEELLKSGFSSVYIYNKLPKHFLVVGKKDSS